MLVDDKQAREKMALECLRPEPECCGNVENATFDHPAECCGNWEPREKTADECAIAIRQIDLSDCKVEVLREELLDVSLGTYALNNLRDACSHWSAARDASGNMDVVECELAGVMEARAKKAIEQLSGEVESLSAQVAQTNAQQNVLYDKWVQAVRDVEAAEAQVAELQAQYNELLYGVARKFHGETRHQTALRYINNAETVSVNSGCDAAKESGA